MSEDPTGANAPDSDQQPAAPSPEPPPIPPASPATDAQTAGDAWRDVLDSFDALGSSIATWARAAVNDPENRRHAAELREKLDAVTTKVGAVVDDVASSETGQAVKDAAEKTGRALSDTAGKVTEATAPAVISALDSIASALGKASEHLERASKSGAVQSAEEPAVEAPPVPGSPDVPTHPEPVDSEDTDPAT